MTKEVPQLDTSALTQADIFVLRLTENNRRTHTRGFTRSAQPVLASHKHTVNLFELASSCAEICVDFL